MVDTDKDGEASLEEVLIMLTNYFSDPKERARLIFQLFDTNGDGERVHYTAPPATYHPYRLE